ncbi:MAG TPA: pitrilysin family protein [Patescibacteria group bacterium]|nr:pitrilysin family protein [Patescibacteria group bacterium]
MQFQRTTLPNGLAVLTIPMPSFESSTVMVLVGAGSRYETKKNNGISHFLEHMAFKGTEKRPSAMDISALIDGIGGEFNAFTGKETTGYYIKSAATHAELCLDVLSDMLQHSKLLKEEIEKERGVILEEINLYEDTPSRKIGDIYESLLYGDTPMGWDIAGEKDVIRKITREDFLDYMGSLYSPSNMTVVVAGGIDSEKVNDQVKKYFGDMPAFDTLKYGKVKENQKKPAVLVRKKQTEQVHIAMGFRTVPLTHPDHYILAVLASILGGGMSSRFFSEIREKRGLAYYVRTSSEHYQDAGSLVSTAGLDPKRVNEGVSVMIEEYEKIKTTHKPTKEELTKAKEYIKGHLVLELEDSRAVSSFFADQEIRERKIEVPEEVITKIDKVSLDDINRVANKYIVNSTLNLAVIGNFTDGKKFEKLLRL